MLGLPGDSRLCLLIGGEVNFWLGVFAQLEPHMISPCTVLEQFARTITEEGRL